MKTAIHRRNDCRGCGSGNIELVFSLKPSPIGDEYVTSERLHDVQPSYPIDLFMCSTCGLAQILDVINPDILGGEHLYVTASTPEVAGHFNEYADEVVERARLGANSFVVDLGSHHGNNDGVLLKKLGAKKMRVLGVESDPIVAARAVAGGIETVEAPFSAQIARRIADQRGRAKIITANNVLGNVDDLASWVEGVKELLAADGVFVFESIYLADLVKNKVFDFIYHEHRSLLSVKPIVSMFALAGLELVSVKRVATKGGSLRYYVQRPGGPVARDGSVAAMTAIEDDMGLYKKETFTEFSEKVDLLKEKLRQFLDKTKNEGKSIVGFGASITCTTLIHHFEIGEYLECLVDDNPAKQGRFSPGLHLPVYPSSALLERKPDYVILLAWRYVEPITKKNKAYHDNGGRYIIPVPEFKVI